MSSHIYLVVGSTATIAYGEPRFTNDIDVAINLSLKQVDQFCDHFPAPEFYLSRDAVQNAVLRGLQFNLIHPASGLNVDFMILTEQALSPNSWQTSTVTPNSSSGTTGQPPSCFSGNLMFRPGGVFRAFQAEEHVSGGTPHPPADAQPLCLALVRQDPDHVGVDYLDSTNHPAIPPL